ncbi:MULTISPECIES: STAS domain-containing protein [Crateriforma]|uniref:STAS domain-containing protein n=1 Tax=Crateriforma conspicua TaxID=2527996 RepID=A0A5C5Y6L4_9PLAN|nr:MULTISPECIES: STAS domain-containing protein [Crateriforma]QDV65402.1 hypothetical protein Mal65_45730 [Crateriforma conspicua]TWT70794.1 hypothetical protein Pan14r_31020 [Crateriforma conspicua]TWU65263.1 hypothetical protein V7x_08090 [Crateriforma conspicua]
MTEPLTTFNVSHVDEVTVIFLKPLDFLQREVITRTQEELLEFLKQQGPQKLVINFKDVAGISSEFIGTLLRARDYVMAVDGQMRLSNMNDNIHTAFCVTNLKDRIFPIDATMPRAIDALHGIESS